MIEFAQKHYLGFFFQTKSSFERGFGEVETAEFAPQSLAEKRHRSELRQDIRAIPLIFGTAPLADIAPEDSLSEPRVLLPGEFIALFDSEIIYASPGIYHTSGLQSACRAYSHSAGAEIINTGFPGR